jgi:O-methyltransferase
MLSPPVLVLRYFAIFPTMNDVKRMAKRAAQGIARGLLRNGLRLVSRSLSTDARFVLLTEAGRALVPAYRFKRPAMAWWEDRAFNDYLERFGEFDFYNTDRRLALAELLRLVARVPGDTAECGVYKGSTSYLICAANATNDIHPNRIHHVFDSFEGLSGPSPLDGTYWTAGALAFGLEGVKQNLSEFESLNRIRYYRGWIPERFPEITDKRFAFVHIDVDLHQPTKDSFEFFYPRMNEGGILVCDDYGFTSCPGVGPAIDAYLTDKPEKMVRLASGGGFCIKGLATSTPVLA